MTYTTYRRPWTKPYTPQEIELTELVDADHAQHMHAEISKLLPSTTIEQRTPFIEANIRLRQITKDVTICDEGKPYTDALVAAGTTPDTTEEERTALRLELRRLDESMGIVRLGFYKKHGVEMNARGKSQSS